MFLSLHRIRFFSFFLPVTVVTIDLKAETFVPGKKNYERARVSLEERLEETFDVIVAWSPPEENVCPSSVAAWFHERGYQVSLCRRKVFKRKEHSLLVPTLEAGYDTEKFFEWLGVFSVSGDLVNGKPDDYVNTYECPSPSAHVGQVQYLQFTGFFTRRQLENLYNSVKKYVLSGNTSLWISLHVQGFADSPVSWDLKEHKFFTDGDNSYTVVFQPSGESIIRKSMAY